MLSGTDEVATLRTTADGTTRFLPGLVGQPVDGTFTLRAGAVSAEAVAGSAVELIVDRPGGAAAPVPLDVLFLLDATGSMGDEIDRLKTSIDSVAARVADLDGSPDVRFGMTLYRDEGDAFVTSTTTSPATSRISGQRWPRSAPAAAATTPRPSRKVWPRHWACRAGGIRRARRCSSSSSWPTPHRRPSGASRCTYPDGRHGRRGPRDQDLPGGLVRERRPRRGGVPADGPGHGCTLRVPELRGRGAATGKHTDIDSTDYEELSLDDLIVRLMAEELSALTGDAAVVPMPSPVGRDHARRPVAGTVPGRPQPAPCGSGSAHNAGRGPSAGLGEQHPDAG